MPRPANMPEPRIHLADPERVRGRTVELLGIVVDARSSSRAIGTVGVVDLARTPMDEDREEAAYRVWEDIHFDHFEVGHSPVVHLYDSDTRLRSAIPQHICIVWLGDGVVNVFAIAAFIDRRHRWSIPSMEIRCYEWHVSETNPLQIGDERKRVPSPLVRPVAFDI